MLLTRGEIQRITCWEIEKTFSIEAGGVLRRTRNRLGNVQQYYSELRAACIMMDGIVRYPSIKYFQNTVPIRKSRYKS
jgi:hypothetical protein